MAKRKVRARATTPVEPKQASPSSAAPAVRSSLVLRAAGAILVAIGSLTFLTPMLGTQVAIAVALGRTAPFVGGALAVVGIVMLLIALQREPGEPSAPIHLTIWKLLVPGYNLYHFIVAFLLPSWKQIDEEAAAEREARKKAGKGHDWRPLVVFCTGAVFLALMEYAGHDGRLQNGIWSLNDLLPPAGAESDTFWGHVRDGEFRGLYGLAWWAIWRVLGFFVLPAIVLKLMGEKISHYGLQTRGFLEHAWIYGFFYCIALVMVIAVSFDDTFQTYYPFYKTAWRSWYDFWAWELLYAAQFFSLEFFFRGVWLKAAKTTMGSGAIIAMVVPYCMIHFGKPFPETLGAILAGIVLGTLALRTRSIWSGFLIHVSVAISMDLAALLQTTGLPTLWWPAF